MFVSLAFLMNDIYALIEVLEPTRNYRTASFIMAAKNTVQFMTASVYGLTKTSKWERIKSSDIQIKMEIMLGDKLMFRDRKTALETNYFYTTPVDGKYYVIFTLHGTRLKEYGKIGIDAKTFSGEESMPVIVSNGDVELTKAENFIKSVLEYAKKNLTLQDVDFEDDKHYKDIFDGILRTAVFLLVLKVIATLFTLFYSNWKTKQFFKTEKITQ
ncbi:hypothetical protein ECANGB1_916 [Enterospora canceri]|uniref:GOLD domain-containing protein n=1 Tax=Enterospora canceri TaxID=1081671 RepID=A0A1Y1S7A7_9MICR|nr:hypothetical protein ECANGB1_916 [Enterospora canceri]